MNAPSSRIVPLGADRPSIEVLEAGSGPPLFFLHGAGGIPIWEGAMALLAGSHRVYAPLLPGFGQSTGLEFLEDQFDLFLHCFDVMEVLQLDRPYVVGESMGGWIAAEMAALRPDRISRLALAAPLGLWRDEAPVADMFGAMTHEMVPLLFHDLNCPAAQAMLGLKDLISDKDDRSQEQIELLIAMARGARTAAKFLFPIPESGLERRLWRITAPALIIWGTEDRFIAPLYADIFTQRIRGAQVRKIPEAGHLIALERPEAFAEAVIQWGRAGG